MNNPALFVRIMWTNTKPVFRFSEPPFTIDKIRDWVGTRTSVPRDNVKLTKYNPINGIYPELLDGFSIEQYNLADESTIRAWLRNEKGFDGKEKVGVRESGSNEQALDIAKVDPKGGRMALDKKKVVALYLLRRRLQAKKDKILDSSNICKPKEIRRLLRLAASAQGRR